MPGTVAPAPYHHSQTKTSKSEKVTVSINYILNWWCILLQLLLNYSQFWLNRTTFTVAQAITTIILSGCLYGQTYGLSVRLYSYVCDDWGMVLYGPRGCKNRPAPFPGQILYNTTKPGSVYPLSSSRFLSVSVVLLTRTPFCVVLFVCSVSWFLLGCQYQCKWLTGKTRLWNDL